VLGISLAVGLGLVPDQDMSWQAEVLVTFYFNANSDKMKETEEGI
jgi:carbohydrate-binding DOMON domain-containing protein